MKQTSSDFQHNWHPCSQMKDYEDFPTLNIKSAKGIYFYLKDNSKVIDAISSWWCKSFGHGNSKIKDAVVKQIDNFEHVIFANTTSDLAITFGKKLSEISPTLNKAFYTSDGSSAVEIALKMSHQFHQQSGNPQKTLFAHLDGSYHGETILTYSVSDLGLYKDKFEELLKPSLTLPIEKRPSGIEDPLWKEDKATWDKWLPLLKKNKKVLSAVIIEPVLQGAGGMLLYSPYLIKQLRKWTSENDVHLIADEIMTGIGRTGKLLAMEHANVEPDFCCLMKSLTAGWAPFSCVLTKDQIYNTFYGDYIEEKAFMHSNTFSGYALGMAAASKVLDIIKEEKTISYIENNSYKINDAMVQVQNTTKRLTNIRSLGWMAAADLCDEDGKTFPSSKRIGFEVFKEAVKLGIYLRPLGNTIYFLPPFTITDDEIKEMTKLTIEAIKKVL